MSLAARGDLTITSFHQNGDVLKGCTKNKVKFVHTNKNENKILYVEISKVAMPIGVAD